MWPSTGSQKCKVFVHVSAYTSLEFFSKFLWLCLFYDPFEKFSAAPVVFVYLGCNTLLKLLRQLLYFICTFFKPFITLCVLNALHLKRFTFFLIMLMLVMHFCRCQKIDQQGNTMVCPTVPSKRGQNHWSSSYWGKSLYINEHIVFSLKIDIMQFVSVQISISIYFLLCHYISTPQWFFKVHNAP